MYVLKGTNSWPEAYAGALAKLAGDAKPELVFVASTLRGKDIAAGVAARLQGGPGLGRDCSPSQRNRF